MSSGNPSFQGRRRAVLATLSRATGAELAEMVARLGDRVGHATDVRPPESGLVMLRARIGGDGAPFNAGEATVSRAVVQLADGTVGYGYRLGRDASAARNAAILDAAWQRSDLRAYLETEILAPIHARISASETETSRRAAATRVEFFTLARETA